MKLPLQSPPEQAAARERVPGETPMKIKSVTPLGISTPLTEPIIMAKNTVTHANSMVVRIEDTEGHVGWGEASEAPMMNGETVPGMLAAVEHLMPSLIGLELAGPGDFYGAIRRRIYGNDGAIGALDIAIYDLFGKREGKPVYDLLGGKKRDRVPVLWMLAANKTAPDVEAAKRKAGEGFIAFKVKTGINPPAEDLPRCRAVRDAVGAAPRISADANMGFAFADAIAFAEGAGDAGLDFIEQPIDAHDLSGMAKITEAAGTSGKVGICADEGIHTLDDVTAHHDAKAATGCGFKIIKLGGLTRVREGAALADSYGFHVNIAGKMAETAIASAALVHMAMAAPQIDWDTSATCQYVAKDVAKNPPTAVDGHLSVDDTPGLGLDFDEDEIARVTVLQ
jgi:L-alanine-DL-glutamate epimerase-like enolase superfamily enzyme